MFKLFPEKVTFKQLQFSPLILLKAGVSTLSLKSQRVKNSVWGPHAGPSKAAETIVNGGAWPCPSTAVFTNTGYDTATRVR